MTLLSSPSEQLLLASDVLGMRVKGKVSKASCKPEITMKFIQQQMLQEHSIVFYTIEERYR